MKRICCLILTAFFCTGSIFSQPCNSRICNGGFDSTGVVPASYLCDSTIVYCWHTTATDKKMEIWPSGSGSVTAYSGIQFAELNATQAATMYQIINLTANSNLQIKFAHRARCNP